MKTMTKPEALELVRGLPDGGREMLRGLLDEVDGEEKNSETERARIDALIKAGRPPHPLGRSHSENGDILRLKTGEKLFDRIEHSLPADVKASDLDFGRWIKGVCTGRWNDAEAERKTLAGGSDILGGYLLPSPLSARVIDLARNRSVCFAAGAQTIPMESGTLDIARLTSDPVAYWKRENVAGTPSDIGTGRFTLRARTLMALVKSSVELIEDAKNAGPVIENAMASALALELDRAALRGSGAGEEPLGIRNWTALGANYGAQHLPNVGAISSFVPFSTAVQMIQQANGPSSGLSIIYSPRDSGTIDRLVDKDDNPLTPPASWAGLAKFVTNQVPTNLGVGLNKSEAYIADFTQLAIGVRTQLSIQASAHAADAESSAFRNYQIWLRCVLRADVVLLQPAHFVLLDAIG